MNKTKALSIAVIVLIILNIGLIAIIAFNKPPHPKHLMENVGPKQVIINRLYFDEAQIVAYDALINEHRTNIIAKEEELKSAKKELYGLLATDDQTDNTIIIAKINTIQREIEEIHFNHFLDIKKLCTSEQLNDFNELTNELARLFSPHPKRK